MTKAETIRTVRTVQDLRSTIADWRKQGERVALVPTMGALHEGHLTLARRARERADRVCVTLFVNPTQFGKNEDLSTYPRNEERDRALLENEGVDLLFAPGLEEMYDKGSVTRVIVDNLGDEMEGAHRPGFFVGVATVVTKLLLQSLPDVALFGEKDFQQLQVIKRLVTDLHIPVLVEGVATVRETDGLAMSSRNAYLTPEDRLAAPTLYAVLNQIAESLRSGAQLQDAFNQGRDSLLQAGFSSVDYLTLRDVETLAESQCAADLKGQNGRILGAAQLGKTRMIDNIDF